MTEGRVSVRLQVQLTPDQSSNFLFLCLPAGRLLRANQISFNWDRLASWINLTEQWPYRTSWLILYLEETDGVPDQATLKTIYERSGVTSKTAAAQSDFNILILIQQKVSQCVLPQSV